MITFITGAMKAGKSLRLIDSIESRGSLLAYIIKPSIDTRDSGHVTSRGRKKTYDAAVINERNWSDVSGMIGGIRCADILYIDEAQFFSGAFMSRIVRECRMNGVEIVAAGLLKDFRHETFPSSYYLLHEADHVVHLKAHCDYCRAQAPYNVRLLDGRITYRGDSVGVEGEFEYKTVCADCKRRLKG